MNWCRQANEPWKICQQCCPIHLATAASHDHEAHGAWLKPAVKSASALKINWIGVCLICVKKINERVCTCIRWTKKCQHSQVAGLKFCGCNGVFVIYVEKYNNWCCMQLMANASSWRSYIASTRYDDEHNCVAYLYVCVCAYRWVGDVDAAAESTPLTTQYSTTKVHTHTLIGWHMSTYSSRVCACLMHM